jgi:hypothetical protein
VEGRSSGRAPHRLLRFSLSGPTSSPSAALRSSSMMGGPHRPNPSWLRRFRRPTGTLGSPRRCGRPWRGTTAGRVITRSAAGLPASNPTLIPVTEWVPRGSEQLKTSGDTRLIPQPRHRSSLGSRPSCPTACSVSDRRTTSRDRSSTPVTIRLPPAISSRTYMHRELKKGGASCVDHSR